MFHAWLYVSAEALSAADAVEDRIVRAAERLRMYPALGARGRVPGTREFPVARTRFTIVYRVTRLGVSVIRVLHQRLKYP